MWEVRMKVARMVMQAKPADCHCHNIIKLTTNTSKLVWTSYSTNSCRTTRSELLNSVAASLKLRCSFLFFRFKDHCLERTRGWWNQRPSMCHAGTAFIVSSWRCILFSHGQWSRFRNTRNGSLRPYFALQTMRPDERICFIVFIPLRTEQKPTPSCTALLANRVRGWPLGVQVQRHLGSHCSARVRTYTLIKMCARRAKNNGQPDFRTAPGDVSGLSCPSVEAETRPWRLQHLAVRWSD